MHVAMQSSLMNREIAMDEAIHNRDSIVKEVIELFLDADTDISPKYHRGQRNSSVIYSVLFPDEV